MKKRVWFITVPAACLLAGLALVGPSLGQQAAQQGGGQQGGGQQGGGQQGGGGLFQGGGQAVRAADMEARSRIRELVQLVSDATNGEERAERTERLQTAIGESFDEDMKARAAQLTQLEERVKKLRTQLDRRRTAKAEIIELQIKVLLNEADGLGFSGASLLDRPSNAVFYYYDSPNPLGMPAVPDSTQPR